MASDLARLIRIASAVRDILERASGSNEDPSFQNFPHGSCGNTAELLGRYLIEIAGLEALYVSARRADSWSHAWLIVGDIIIDITADQFGESPVMVTRDNAWHDQWDQEAPRPPICSHKLWPYYPFGTWGAIVDGMADRGFPEPQ